MCCMQQGTHVRLRIGHHVGEDDHVLSLREQLNSIHGIHHIEQSLRTSQKYIDPCPIHCVLDKLVSKEKIRLFF